MHYYHKGGTHYCVYVILLICCYPITDIYFRFGNGKVTTLQVLAPAVHTTHLGLNQEKLWRATAVRVTNMLNGREKSFPKEIVEKCHEFLNDLEISLTN